MRTKALILESIFLQVPLAAIYYFPQWSILKEVCFLPVSGILGGTYELLPKKYEKYIEHLI